jgi:hypothetical protein
MCTSVISAATIQSSSMIAPSSDNKKVDEVDITIKSEPNLDSTIGAILTKKNQSPPSTIADNTYYTNAVAVASTDEMKQKDTRQIDNKSTHNRQNSDTSSMYEVPTPKSNNSSPARSRSSKSFSCTKVNNGKRLNKRPSPKRLDYSHDGQKQEFNFDVEIVGDDDDDSSATSGEDEEVSTEQTQTQSQLDHEAESEIYDLSNAKYNHSPKKGYGPRFVTPASIRNKEGKKDLERKSIAASRMGEENLGEEQMPYSNSDATTTSDFSLDNDTQKRRKRYMSSNDPQTTNQRLTKTQFCLPVNNKPPSGLLKMGKHNMDTASTHDTKQQEKQSTNDFQYQEVVRGKKAREALRGYDCEECRGFLSAVCDHPGGDVFDRNKLIQRCSRHRARNTPPSTPDGFWELSFADERAANDDSEADV